MKDRSIPFFRHGKRMPNVPDRPTPEAAYTIIAVNHSSESGKDARDPLRRYRDAWRRERMAAPCLLDDAWEHAVMRAVRAEAAKPRLRNEPDMYRWLAVRLRPLVLANAALILLSFCVWWHWNPSSVPTGLQAYAQISTLTYDEFHR